MPGVVLLPVGIPCSSLARGWFGDVVTVGTVAGGVVGRQQTAPGRGYHDGEGGRGDVDADGNADGNADADDGDGDGDGSDFDGRGIPVIGNADWV